MTERTSAARSRAASNPVHLRFDRFALDEANASLLCAGKPVILAPTPFAVLCALAREPGALRTKNELLDEVWGHQFVTESVLKTVIAKLRTALGDDPRQPRFIETVSRRGYRFIAETVPIAPGWSGEARPPANSAPEFVGREDALAELRTSWQHACAGKRVLAWVVGEPGIGKTTLIERFLQDLGEVPCIRGQCVEQYGSGEPYLPVLEALGELCRRDPTAIRLLRTVAPTWLLQLPWLTTAEERDALRRDLAGVAPDRRLREMGEFLDRYTERQPLLLVTEDLHWSDRSTTQLIDYMARRRGSARFMWLASFRLAEIVALDHPLHALRRELRLHGLVNEIVLDTFSETEVGRYVAKQAPEVANDESFVRALHERTDGLPLFVASVMSDVMARFGAKGHAAAAWIAGTAVPENLAAIIDHYIAILAEDQRMLLSAAAVCGNDFRAGTLAQVLERDPDDATEACEDLARRQVWLTSTKGGQQGGAPEQPYAFRHALFRQVMYERMPASLRIELHRKVAKALEQERDAGVAITAAELAVHFERGREPMAALRYYAEAARSALLQFSPSECLTLSQRALSLLAQAPEGSTRDELEMSLATLEGASASHLFGVSSDEAKAAFGRAYAFLNDHPNHPLRVLLLHGYGLGLVVRAEYDEALEVAERGCALATTTADAVVLADASFVQAEVHMMRGRPRLAREWIERGLAALAPVEQESPDTLIPQVSLLSLLAVQLLHLGQVESACRVMREANARAREFGQPVARMIALWLGAMVGVRLGDGEQVAKLADEMHALVEESALAQGRAASAWFRGWTQAQAGEARQGYLAIRKAYEENRRLGMVAGSSEVLGYAAEALLLAGDVEGARRELAEAFEICERHGERVYRPQLLELEAAIARTSGNAAGARDSLRRALEEARSQEAAWLELALLVELSENGEATTQDRKSMAELVHRLPEAAGTTLVARAHAQLGRTKAR